MTLHNFIRDSKILDEDFDRCDRDENYVPAEASIPEQPRRNTRAVEEEVDMNTFRDQIAHALFNRS